MGLLSPWLASQRLKRVCKWVIGDAVLDVGCADGRLLGYLTKPEDLRYVGIDAGGREIAAAKTRFPEREFYALFVTENTDLPFRAGFDCIVMSAFIEHVDNPSGVLTRLKRELKPGGRVIITTPTCAAQPVLRFGSRLGIFSKEAFGEHKSHFGKDELVKVLADAGLRIEHYERFQFGFNQLAVARAKD
jgi:2-polyprenyl-3-methyl-5-hydroxy-6-metoxy-1,4-benzoquinol methylase